MALALAAGRPLGRLPGGGIRRHYEGVYALGVALAAFGVVEVTYGNGLIAAFVCGIGFAIARSELPAAFLHFNENVSATFQVITFVLFGALIVPTGWRGSVWRLVLFIAFALFVAARLPCGSPSQASTCRERRRSLSPGSGRRESRRCCSAAHRRED